MHPSRVGQSKKGKMCVVRMMNAVCQARRKTSSLECMESGRKCTRRSVATTVKMLDEQEHEGNSDGKVDCGVSCIVRCNYKSVVSIKCQLSDQFPLRIA